VKSAYTNILAHFDSQIPR